jgi:hypothetical protein
MSTTLRLALIALLLAALAGVALVLADGSDAAQDVAPSRGATRASSTLATPDAPAALPESSARAGPSEAAPQAGVALVDPTTAPGEAEAPRRLRGRVVRSSDRSPLPRVRVELLAGAAPDQPVLMADVTTLDGAFEFPVCDQRARALRLSWLPTYPALHQGNEWDERMSLAAIVGSFELPADPCELGVLEVPLDTGWILGGRVLGADGPVLGAFVSIDQRLPQSMSGIDGTYLIRDIPRREAPVVVAGWAPDRRTQVFELSSPPPDRWRLQADLRLDLAGTIEGRVDDAQGSLLPDAVVRVLVTRGGPSAPDAGRASDGRSAAEVWSEQDALPSATTAADGTYRIEGLPLGTYRLVATAPRGTAGNPGYRATSRSDVVVDGREPTPVNLSVGGGAELPGRLGDAKGEPLDAHGVELWVLADGPGLLPESAPICFTTSDAEGAFQFPDVAAGTYRLVVRAPRLPARHTHADGWRPLTWTSPRLTGFPSLAQRPVEWLEDVDVGEGARAPLDVVVRAAPGFRVRVTDTRGELIESAAITWIPESAGDRYAGVYGSGGILRVMGASDALGASMLGTLVRFEAPGYLSRVVPLRSASLAGGLDAEFQTLVLHAAPTLRVLVADADTHDMLGEVSGTLHLRGGGRFDAARVVESLDGRLQLAGDRPEGSLVLIVTAPGHKRFRYEAKLTDLPTSGELFVLLEKQE